VCVCVRMNGMENIAPERVRVSEEETSDGKMVFSLQKKSDRRNHKRLRRGLVSIRRD